MPRSQSRNPRTSLILAGVGVLIVLLYSAYAAYPFFRGPVLVLESPETTATSTLITGHTTRVSALTINGLPVPLDETGNFRVARSFPPGYTIVVVRGLDRFGRIRERTITFVTPPYASKEIKVSTGTATST